jgi:hypothetical protein
MMMLKGHNIGLATATIFTLLGCSQAGQDTLPPAAGNSPESPFARLASAPPPADPDAPVTLTVVGRTGRTIASQTTTRGELWRAAQAPAQSRSVSGNVEQIRSAAILETCNHASLVVFNDGKYFNGPTTICFKDDGVADGDNSEPVNDLTSYGGFSAKSYWTYVPICVWNADRTLRDYWQLYNRPHQNDDIYSGASPARYIQTPGNDMDIECPSAPPR